jgi:hypothetical protein
MNALVSDVAKCVWALTLDVLLRTGARRMDVAAEHRHTILLARV